MNPALTLTTAPSFELRDRNGVRLTTAWRQDLGRYIAEHWHEVDELEVVTTRRTFHANGCTSVSRRATSARSWYGDCAV